MSAPHNQLGRTKKKTKISSQYVKGRHQAQFKFESSYTAETAWMHPWSYCFCCIPKCICLWRYCQFLSISFCLWSGNGLQFQFTCCPVFFAGGVNSCLKHSAKLLLLMVAQVHRSHWVEGSHFTSNKRVERMGTSDSLTKAIFVSSKQLHPGRPDAFNVGTVKLWFKMSF